MRTRMWSKQQGTRLCTGSPLQTGQVKLRVYRLQLIEPLGNKEKERMRYLRFKELRQRVPLGRTTIWRMMREGGFPKSTRIGKAATAWLEHEIDEWIKKRAGTEE